MPAAAAATAEWIAAPPPDAADSALAARVDARLVRRALDGDEAAFGELVDRYDRRVFWIAYHVVGDVEDARDVAQEAFLRLFRSLDRFDFGRSFYTWFYRIVVNLAIDRLRKARGTRAPARDDVLLGVPAADDGAVPAEAAETRDLVWSVLDQLDAKFRAVLVLRDLHGLSCREIAPVLKVTHATVRWRLHRGRKLFREQWERRQRRGSVG